jgi:hypothetical protein
MPLGSSLPPASALAPAWPEALGGSGSRFPSPPALLSGSRPADPLSTGWSGELADPPRSAPGSSEFFVECREPCPSEHATPTTPSAISKLQLLPK